MATFKIVFTLDVFFSAETTMHCKVTCILYKKQAHFSQLCIIFDVSSGFYLWNINKTTTWHLQKMLKFAFKDVSTKNSEPTYWTILFVMLKIYFIYKIAGAGIWKADDIVKFYIALLDFFPAIL
jgi:hypothetical protein